MFVKGNNIVKETRIERGEKESRDNKRTKKEYSQS